MTQPPDRFSPEAEILVSVEGLWKKYCRSLRRSLYYGARDVAVEMAGLARRGDTLRRGEFWALRDVNFTLRRGESLALVGANGSGKTTLLRILGGLIKPDLGKIMVRGTVAPLIALGAGFSPVLTGRENIYTNLAILGLTGEQIHNRFDAVLDFAEIDPDAVDAPVRSYSSGMAARLGFACAIHTDPDVFLIDEVLAVGDLRFRLKCYRKLAELRERGTSFILVSHNPQVIHSNCESALFLARGEMKSLGAVADVMADYENDLFHHQASEVDGRLRLPERSAEESQGLDILGLHFETEDGEPLGVPVSGCSAVLCISVKVHAPQRNVTATLLVKERFGEADWALRLSSLGDQESFDLDPGSHQIRLDLPHLGLRPADYVMKLNVARGANFLFDVVEAFPFRVRTEREMSQCAYFQPREWEVVRLASDPA